jgi:aminopeptidase N
MHSLPPRGGDIPNGRGGEIRFRKHPRKTSKGTGTAALPYPPGAGPRGNENRRVEAIEIEVLTRSSRIVLNAVETEIWNASLVQGSTREELQPQFNAADELVQFTPSTPLEPGSYTLSFSFRSKIRTDSRGLFVQSYEIRGGAESILAIQFESADARRAFPCWDEPSFRATFQLSVKTLKTNVAVSNMPAVEEQAASGEKRP